MMTLPSLGDRGIASYNRLGQELAAFNHALRVARPNGAFTAVTLFTFNGLVNRANRLFCRHADLPHFYLLSLDATLSHADLAVQLARLTAACLAFEQRYAHLTEEGHARAKMLRQRDHAGG
ncbi:MAG: hypothetical protein ACOH2N_08110 [Devosia sp.]